MPRWLRTSAFISFGDLTIHQGDAVIGHGLSVAGVSTFNGRIDGQNGQRSVLVGTGLSVAGITTLPVVVASQPLAVNFMLIDLSVMVLQPYWCWYIWVLRWWRLINDNITLDTNLNIWYCDHWYA